MALATTASRVEYEGTGTTGPFSYPFRITAKAHLEVTKRSAAGAETTLALTTGYTVTGVNNRNGGTITLTSALAVGETLVIRRVVPRTQDTQFRTQSAYLPETVEDAFDRVVMIDQQQQDEIDRCLQLPVTLADVATTLPTPEADHALAWNSDGTGLENRAVDLAGVLRAAGTVDLFDHGAAGDGATDDAGAFTEALAALPSAGGRIRLRSGRVYRIASVVVLDRPVLIESVGPGTATIDLAASELITAAADNVHWNRVRFEGDSVTLLTVKSSDAGDHTGWRWQDCIFDGVSPRLTKLGRQQQDGSTAGTGTDVVARSSFVGCEVTNVLLNYAVELGGVEDVALDRCWVHHNGDGGVSPLLGEGVKILAGSTGCRVVNSVLEYNGRDGIDLYDASGCLVAFNVLRGNVAWGAEVKWAATDANAQGRNQFIGNRVEDNGGGINADADYCLVSGNICRGNGTYNIRAAQSVDTLAPTRFVVITGNVCEGADYGISCGNGTQFTISGNQCHDAAVIGIALGVGTSRFAVTGNVCEGNGSNGIRVFGDGHTVYGNQTQDPDGNAVVDASATNLVFTTAGAASSGVTTAGDLRATSVGSSLVVGSPTLLPQVKVRAAGTASAAGGYAIGVSASSTLTATANSDVLYGAFIAPTFDHDGFTGVADYGVRVGDVAGGVALETGLGLVRLGDGLHHTGGTVGFFNATPAVKPTITGSRGGNAALASLLTAGATLGLWTDSTTA